MLIDIFNEIPWQNFQQLESIKDLPLNEQKEKYEYYLSEIELARDTITNIKLKVPQVILILLLLVLMGWM